MRAPAQGPPHRPTWQTNASAAPIPIATATADLGPRRMAMSELIESRGDCAIDLEAADDTLDAAALTEAFAVADRRYAVGFRWDDRQNGPRIFMIPSADSYEIQISLIAPSSRFFMESGPS
jgi:hypothetical protein